MAIKDVRAFVDAFEAGTLPPAGEATISQGALPGGISDVSAFVEDFERSMSLPPDKDPLTRFTTRLMGRAQRGRREAELEREQRPSLAERTAEELLSAKPMDVVNFFADPRKGLPEISRRLMGIGGQQAAGAIAGPSIALQEDRPEDVAAEFAAGISGQSRREVYDVFRGAGMPEFPARLSGLFVEAQLDPARFMVNSYRKAILSRGGQKFIRSLKGIKKFKQF